MLGPADEYPAGSAEWALRLANELNYTVRNAGDFGVEPIIPLVAQAINHSPWKVWPEGNPAGDIDHFFLYATGRDFQQIYILIKGYVRDDDLARRLAAAKGKDESEIGPGRPNMEQNHRDSMNLAQGNTDNHLLRRLARDHAEIMKRYEAGEFPTVRAAARAAGIKVDPTQLQILWRAWKRASDEERALFLNEIALHSLTVVEQFERLWSKASDEERAGIRAMISRPDFKLEP
jgi:hypothetical protein